MSSAGLAVWVVVALAPQTSVESSSASPPAPSTQAEPEVASRRVVLAVPPSRQAFEPSRLRSALDVHFSDSGFALEVVPLAADSDLPEHIEWASSTSRTDDVHAVFWIESTAPGVERLYLLQPKSERIWVRELPQASDPELVVESLGVMLRAQSAGLDEGRDPVGMEAVVVEREPDPALSPPPPERSRATPERRLHLWVAAEYVGGNLDDRAPWLNGIGGRLGIVDRSGGLAYIGLAWQGVSKRDAAPGLSIQRVPIVVGGGFRFRKDKALSPEIDAGLTGELLFWDADDTVGVDGRAGRAWRFAVSPGAGLSWRVWRGLGVHAHLRADIWVWDVELVVDSPGGRTVAMSPHPVSAALRLGLHYRF